MRTAAQYVTSKEKLAMNRALEALSAFVFCGETLEQCMDAIKQVFDSQSGAQLLTTLERRYGLALVPIEFVQIGEPRGA